MNASKYSAKKTPKTMIAFKDGEAAVFVGPYDTEEKAIFVAKRLTAAGVGQTELLPIEWATSWQEVEAHYLARNATEEAPAEVAPEPEPEVVVEVAKPKRARGRRAATSAA